MNNPAEDADFRTRVQKLEALLREIEETADPVTRSRTVEVVQTLMEFHGAGLKSILDHLAQAGEAGTAIVNKMAADDLVSSLLLLYNLHPSDIDTRVKHAIDRLRPTLAKHHFEIELISVSDGIVRVRLETSGHACQSTAANMKRTVEEAIYDRAPDVVAIEVISSAPAAGPSGFVPLEQLTAGHNGHRQTKLGVT